MERMTTYPKWEEVAREFAPEGSLRDIYVLGTTAEDWARVLDAVRHHYAPLTFTAGGEPTELPNRAADIFPLWERETAPLLRFEVEGILVTCHFFTPEEIEFSIDPEDVTGRERLEATADFLRIIARAVGKPALLTPESLPQSPILRAEPTSDRIVYLPPPTAS